MAISLIDATLKPIYTIRNIFGLASFNRNLSFFVCLKTAIFILVYVAIMYYILIDQVELTSEVRNYLLQYITLISRNATGLMTLITIVEEYLARPKIIKIITNIRQIDEIINKNMMILSAPFDYTVARRYVHIMLILSLAGVASNSFLIYYFYAPFMPCLLLVATFATATMPGIVCNIMLSSVHLFFSLANSRFLWINKELASINRNNHTRIMNYKLSTEADVKKQLLILQILRQIYSKQNEICALVLKSYNKLILLYVFLTFLVLVSQLYQFSLYILHQAEQYTSGEIALSILWILHSIGGLLIITIYCYWISKEAAKTGALLHGTRNRDEIYIREAVKQWSLELLHGTVAFKVCGMFSADMTLVFAVLGSVTTYLVILIQFNLSAVGSNRNNQQCKI